MAYVALKHTSQSLVFVRAKATTGANGAAWSEGVYRTFMKSADVQKYIKIFFKKEGAEVREWSTVL